MNTDIWIYFAIIYYQRVFVIHAQLKGMYELAVWLLYKRVSLLYTHCHCTTLLGVVVFGPTGLKTHTFFLSFFGYCFSLLFRVFVRLLWYLFMLKNKWQSDLALSLMTYFKFFFTHSTTLSIFIEFHLWRRKATRAAIILLPLLGTTWIFGLVAFGSGSVVLFYVFVILNSLQVHDSYRVSQNKKNYTLLKWLPKYTILWVKS